MTVSISAEEAGDTLNPHRFRYQFTLRQTRDGKLGTAAGVSRRSSMVLVYAKAFYGQCGGGGMIATDDAIMIPYGSRVSAASSPVSYVGRASESRSHLSWDPDNSQRQLAIYGCERFLR